MKISKLFNRIYSGFHNDNSFLEKIKMNSLGRYITRKIANMIIPLWYNVKKTENKGITDEKRKKQIIVSLTSYPDRIKKIPLVIESLLRQTLKPDKIILWLSKEQFPHKDSNLPLSIRLLMKRGLEIEFVENDIKSHKKYYYVMKYYPDSIIITVDDDIFYPEDLIENLMIEHESNPHAVICSYARKLEWNNGGEMKNNIKWKHIKKRIKGNNVFFGTGGGTLFPSPQSLWKDVFNLKLSLTLCPSEDDLWLNTMVRLGNIPIIASIKYKDILPVLQDGNSPLFDTNISKTDVQMKAVMKYYSDNDLYPFIYE